MIKSIIDLFKDNNSALWADQGKLKVSFSDSFVNSGIKEKLIQHKEELLELLKTNHIRSEKDFYRTSIFQYSQHATYPMSFAQERLWFIEQYEQGSNAYHIPLYLELKKSTDVQQLKWAIEQVVQRHEVLRTVFKQIDDEYVQIALDQQLVINDYHHSKHDLCQQKEIDINEPFDLSNQLPIRVSFYHDDVKTALLINTHHVASDGWSLDLLLKEIHSLYQNKYLPELRIQYKDFAVWQKEYLNGETLENQVNYWKERLDDFHPLDLPTDKPRPKQIDYTGDHVTFTINSELSGKLRKLAQKQSSTLYSTLLSAYFILLSKYTQQDDLLVGTPISNRHHEEIRNLIGFFVNSLTIREQISPNETITELISRVQGNMIKAHEHQDIPFEKIVTELNIEQDTSRHPIFQVMFGVQSFSGESESTLFETSRFTDSKSSVYDISWFLDDSQDEIRGRVCFATSLYHKATIEKMIEHYLIVLQIAADHPQRQLSEYQLVTEAEWQTLINDWNQTSIEYPSKMVHELFEEQAFKTPDAIALVFGNIQMTYRELNEKSNQLAHQIRKFDSFNTDAHATSPILLNLDRSLEMIIGILAVLKVGGAYVPMSTELPLKRKLFLQKDTGAAIILSQRNSMNDDFHEVVSDQLLFIDLSESLYSTESTSNLATAGSESDMAYIMYTSGTTGEPKGVPIRHESLMNLVYFHENRYSSFKQKLQVALVSSYHFDFSVQQIFNSILFGHSLHVLSKEKIVSPEGFNQYIIGNEINVFEMTPSLFSELMLPFDNYKESSLKIINLGGEALEPAILNQFLDKSTPEDLSIINTYGPTEFTVDATMFEVPQRASHLEQIPIGKPIHNTKAFVLDKNLAPTPIGIIGELYLGGKNLASGYLNRPDLTAEKFIANPFTSQDGYTKLYKTGDLVKWDTNGNLIYIGRNDSQVKVGGHRIELDEITKTITSLSSVTRAHVFIQQTNERNVLVAYVTAHEKINEEQLLLELEELLPDYMIPARILQVDHFPLTSNGKLDINALPEFSFIETKSYKAPETELEKEFCEIWQDILEVENVGISDNFFRIGGHSILAIKLSHRLNNTLNLAISVADIFTYKTIEKLISSIKKDQDETIEIPVNDLPVYPLSFAQERLWFIELYEGGTNVYHIPSLVKIAPDTDLKKLELAIHEVIDRHEILRTTFHRENGEYTQVVSNEKAKIHRYYHAECDLEEQLQKDIDQPFDLHNEFPIRICFYFHEGETKLLINIHHIACDGWSSEILFKEINTTYANEELPESVLQYKHFSHWQREFLQGELMEKQFGYWAEKLSSHQLLEIPTDHSRPKQFDYSGDFISFELPEALSSRLRQLSKDQGCTMYSSLLAGFYVFLYKYTLQNDIVIGTPFANRHYSGIEDLIGFFTNSLVLRENIQPDNNIADFLSQIQDNLAESQRNQDIPFEILVQKLQLEKDTSRHPLFQVMFSVQSFDNNSNSGLFEAIPINDKYSIAKFDLSCFLDDSEKNIKGIFNFATALYQKETVQRMVDGYLLVLEQMSLQQNTPIKDFSLLTQEEYQQIVIDWNDTNDDIETKDALVHELFEEQVRKTPANTALIFDGQTYTYTELNRRANQLAGYLRKQVEIDSDNIVALLLDRSPEMIIGILASLKAGAAYVPISPSLPNERVEFILNDTKSKLLLTQSHLREKMAEIKSPKAIYLDQVSLDDSLEEKPAIKRRVNDLACVLYTSGTTGTPKGVAIEHKALVNRISHMIDFSKITPSDVYLFKTNYIFDVSISDIFSHLWSGASLVMTRENFSLPEIEQLLLKDITSIHLVPSQFELVAKNILHSTITKIYFSGEKLTINILEQIPSGIKCYNYYGPTELGEITSIISTAENASLIGKLFPNNKAYILNKENSLVPKGTIGELHVSGLNLAREYLNQTELTAQKFIPNPFVNAEEHKNGYSTLYKTGDLVKWTNDGDLEYIGRNDFQVKIRGHRIELEEIEETLLNLEHVNQACVTLKNRTRNAFLVAYYTSDKQLSEEKLQKELSNKVPDYMVPNRLIQLDEFPLTTNGKLDRKKLADKELEDFVMDSTISQSNLGKKIQTIYSEVLGVPKETLHPNQTFFRLGGSSILTIKLQQRLSQLTEFKNITIADLFKYDTISKLEASCNPGYEMDYNIRGKKDTLQKDIAIIALSGAFPSSQNISELWQLISNQKEGTKFHAEEESGIQANDSFVPVSARMADVDLFDPAFWGISPNEAKRLDPQIRKFIEHCWTALESSGYTPKRKEYSIGVYAGSDTSSYLQKNILNGEAAQTIDFWEATTSNNKEALATKVAYLLGLTGPANAISTACSTSLVAIIEACKNLQLGVCDMALAGGVSLEMPDDALGYQYQEGMILSKDGHCRTFDKEASGTILGSGVGVVLLKPLEDAVSDQDTILGVIKGFATNNDGDRKTSFTAPSIAGQSECIINAQKMAGVTSNDIDYVECHGTGTLLGDPIEVQALKEAFDFNASGDISDTSTCNLGSIKANIGHTGSAAGIAGLIKVIGMLENNIIPGQVNFDQANPELHLASSNFQISNVNAPWPIKENKNRLAGISSFGIGGTNAHLIVSDYQSASPPFNDVQLQDTSTRFVFPFSAKNRASLERYKQAFTSYLTNSDVKVHELKDIAYTLQERRLKFETREAYSAETVSELISKLNDGTTTTHIDSEKPNKVVFMFPGYGAQYANMAKELYLSDTVFRKHISQCIEIANDYLSSDLHEVLFPDSAESSQKINAIEWAQISSFVISYSLAKYLNHFGITPDAYIGHSTGEYAAAAVLGVFSLEDAIKLVIKRSQLMQSMAPGSMLSISANEKQIAHLANQFQCEIALINSSEDIVVSGTDENINALSSSLNEAQIEFKQLDTSHGYHSSMMEPAAEDFKKALAEVTINAPDRHKLVSNVTGNWVDATIVSPQYWSNHLRNKVEFKKGIETLYNHFNDQVSFIEIGPGKSLSGFVQRTAKAAKKEAVSTVQLLPSFKESVESNQLRSKEDLFALLWSNDIIKKANPTLDFTNSRNSFEVPVYQFNQQKYWLKRSADSVSEGALQFLPKKEWFSSMNWNSVRNLSTNSSAKSPFFNATLFIVSEKQLSTPTYKSLSKSQCTLVLDHSQESWEHQNNELIYINPTNQKAFEEVSELLKKRHDFTSIVHLATSERNDEMQDPLDYGFYSLFMVRQVLLPAFNLEHLVVLTSELAQITNLEDIHPFNGTMVGAIRNINHEYLSINALIIDIGDCLSEGLSLLPSIVGSSDFRKSESLLAIRNRRLWKQTLQPIPQPQDYAEVIQENDTILITGGLGGVGLAIAKHISQRHQVSFFLTSRTDITQKNDPSPYDTHRIGLINEIISNGCQVEIIAGDISNRDFAKSLIQRTEEKSGAINGIIHTAGIMPLLPENYTIDEVKRAFNGKVYGLNHILQNIRVNSLRFLANTSSNASLMGDVNRFEYCASNSYLDYLCLDKNFFKQTRVITVNWFGWSDVGMVRSEGDYQNTAKEGISSFHTMMNSNGVSSEEGAELFYDLINQDAYEQVSISKLNLVKLREHLFSPNSQEEVSADTPITILDEEYSETEHKIAQLFCEILGITEISVKDNFFKLGGNSISAIRLTHLLMKEMQISISIADIFKFNTPKNLANRSSSNTVQRQKITPATATDVPLSYAQERLWFIEQYENGTNAYHIPLLVQLKNGTRIEKVKQSLHEIVRRHDILRTVFEYHENEFQQVILNKNLSINDYNYLTVDINHQIALDINTPFDLQNEFPIRVSFYHEKEKTSVLINIHHIASDGWSTDIFLRELNALYDDQELPEITIQYKDFTLWQRDYLKGEVFNHQMNYWREKLEGFVPLILPEDKTRPQQIDYSGDHSSFVLKKELSVQLRDLAKQQSSTLNAVLLSGFYLLLNRYSNQNDLIVGTPIANRHHIEIQDTIGFFVNSLALRQKINPDDSILDLIEDVKENLMDSQQHQDIPFEKIVEELSIENDSSRHPIFQVTFVVQSFGDDQENKLFESMSYDTSYSISKFDLSCIIDDSHEEIQGAFNFASAIFDKSTINRMVTHYLLILEQMISVPSKRLRDYPCITNEEYQQIILDWNDTNIDFAHQKTIHELFEEQVVQSPNAIALKFENQTLTYKSLNEKSNQLAHSLREQYRDKTNQELSPNTFIALYLDKSMEMVIAMLAILKAGAAYVPIDVNFPNERVDYILKDINSEFILSSKRRRDQLKDLDASRSIVCVELDSAIYESQLRDNPTNRSHSDDLAYVIYTSGTTGKPNGVMIRHKGLNSNVTGLSSQFGVKSGGNVIQLASYVFDASVLEIFMTLTSGAQLCIVPDIIRRDAYLLTEYLKTQKINAAIIPPSLLSAMEYCQLPHLETIIVAGESCAEDTMKKWSEGRRFINAYGPTESTVCASLNNYRPSDRNTNIGRPIANTKLYVLDKFLTPVPVGVTGELYISGESLCRGYLNNPDLTEKRLLSNPFYSDNDSTHDYSRLYKTGDLVKWLPDGNLEFIGRNDFQVKIHGIRIEPGEIEKALLSIDQMKQVHVAVRENNQEKYIVAYFVAEIALDETMLFEHLSTLLPEHMIPHVFMQIEEFNMTINGKLDQKSLPAPDFTKTTAYVAPDSEFEHQLCAIWQNLLQLEKIGVTDNFFRIGGHSILALKLSQRLKSELSINVGVADIFTNNTIQKLSLHLENITQEQEYIEIEF